jgi:hypothetical protein
MIAKNQPGMDCGSKVGTSRAGVTTVLTLVDGLDRRLDYPFASAAAIVAATWLSNHSAVMP